MAGMADGQAICPPQIGTKRRPSRARLRAETFPYNVQDVRPCCRVTGFELVDREGRPGGLALKTVCRIPRHFGAKSRHASSDLAPRGEIRRTGATETNRTELPDRGDTQAVQQCFLTLATPDCIVPSVSARATAAFRSPVYWSLRSFTRAFFQPHPRFGRSCPGFARCGERPCGAEATCKDGCGGISCRCQGRRR